MPVSLLDVTLVIYDVVAHDLAAVAVADCAARVEFGAVHVWTDQPRPFTDRGRFTMFEAKPGLPKANGQAQLWEDVPLQVETSHVLNVEWDSGISDPDMWDDGFLAYDYIGAPWPFHHDAFTVGNGGFSLLSTRLLRFLSNNRGEYPHVFPWDDTLCRRYRRQLESEGFRWAPEEVASRFAFEHGAIRPVFGFHDCRNFPIYLAYSDLDRRMMAANEYVENHGSWRSMLRGLGR